MSPLTESTRLTLAKGQPVPNDPYLYTNTVLLLHGDGTNGSTNIVDSSKVAGSPKTVTANGNAQISTAQSKFGGASIAFDGTGDFLSTPNNAAWNFGTGDLTIEAWVYIAGNSAADNDGLRVAVVCNTWNSTNPISGWFLIIVGNASTTGTGLQFSTWNSGNATNEIATTTITQSAWNHVAVSISSGTRRLFLNGTLLTSSTTTNGSGSIPAESYGSPLRVGNTQQSSYRWELNGFIDDLRITKGVARYTSNFTPPTLPFPDF
jgi:hypothetical protein